MEYKVIVSPLAFNDIEKITDFYKAITIEIVVRFLEELEEAYKVLSINPHFQIKYKSYRSISSKSFSFYNNF
jgi:toxin ParE1/3/4